MARTPRQAHASALRRASNRTKARGPGQRVRARPILPGVRYKITRRCLERRLFLVPDDAQDRLNNFIGYTLGVFLPRFGLKLHAACVLSNHHHTDVTDTEGRLPAFKEVFHGLLARAVNCLRGRFETFWSPDAACDTQSPDGDEGLGDLVYTLTNPVKDGLVKWGSRWPGFTTYGMKFGETRRFYKPTWFFDEANDDLPAFVDLRLERPKILPELSDDEFHSRLMEKVRKRERELQDEMRAQHRRFMGETKLRRQHWNRTPRSREDRFTTTPRVASSNKWLRLAQLQRNRTWERAYAKARDSLAAGNKVEFPAGTYWMRVYARVKVAADPP